MSCRSNLCVAGRTKPPGYSQIHIKTFDLELIFLKKMFPHWKNITLLENSKFDFQLGLIFNAYGESDKQNTKLLINKILISFLSSISFETMLQIFEKSTAQRTIESYKIERIHINSNK